MSLENPGMYFDATCSWNGYNHQGKLALWYALKKILELYDCGKSEAENLALFDKYFLEIEYLEDFSFGKFSEDGTAEYLFIHQVKNHEKTNASEYDSALLGLVAQIKERNSIQKAYLHTTQKIEFGNKTLIEYLRELVSNPTNLQKTLNEIAEVREDKGEKSKLIMQKRGRATEFKHKLMAAYSESIGKDSVKLTEGNISDALNALEEKVKKQIEESKLITDAQLEKIEEFPYEVNDTLQRYCQVSQIKGLLKEQIKKIIETIPACQAHSYWATGDYIKKRYLFLLGNLDQYIIERNLNYPLYKTGQKDRKISLKKIYEWVTDEVIDREPDEFYLYHIKESFFNVIDQYCSSNRCQRKDTCIECAVHTCVEKIGCMTFSEMKSFLHLTNPTVSDKMSMTTYSKYTGANGIRNPFIYGLSRIAKEFEDDKTAITYKDDNTLSHVLTTILSDDNGRDTPDICLDILKNRELYELMMDCDCFISRDIDAPSIQAEGLKCGYVYEEKYKDHIARFKNVKIEKVDDFIKQISAEG